MFRSGEPRGNVPTGHHPRLQLQLNIFFREIRARREPGSNAGGLLAEQILGLHRAESVPDADTATSGLSTGNGAITLEKLRIQRPDLQGGLNIP